MFYPTRKLTRPSLKSPAANRPEPKLSNVVLPVLDTISLLISLDVMLILITKACRHGYPLLFSVPLSRYRQ